MAVCDYDITMPVEMGLESYGTISIEYGNGSVRVGKYCSIAPHVSAYFCFGHDYKRISTFPFGQPVTGYAGIAIENDVWVGTRTILLPGCTVGDGAVIGAFSVVRGEIPPYSVCMGNPCSPIKYRFSESEIDTLLNLKWWDWSPDIVREAKELIRGTDIDALIDFARKRGVYE